jgi:hypothetical protein
MDNELITTLKKYKDSYDIRLGNHKAKYEDYDELHFINSELCFYHNCYKTANVTERRIEEYDDDYLSFRFRFMNDFEYDDINQIYSNDTEENHVIKGLIKKEEDKRLISLMADGYDLEICNQLTTSFAKIIEYLNIKKNKLTNNDEFPKVKFHGTQTQFMELMKALTENGNLKGIQKDNIEICSNFFDIEIKYPSKLISDITNTRNNGSETLFLNELKKALLDYIKLEKKK